MISPTVRVRVMVADDAVVVALGAAAVYDATLYLAQRPLAFYT
ncbi:MAG: hypothetical protein ABJA87_02065 [bacterium]